MSSDTRFIISKLLKTLFNTEYVMEIFRHKFAVTEKPEDLLQYIYNLMNAD